MEKEPKTSQKKPVENTPTATHINIIKEKSTREESPVSRAREIYNDLMEGGMLEPTPSGFAETTLKKIITLHLEGNRGKALNLLQRMKKSGQLTPDSIGYVENMLMEQNRRPRIVKKTITHNTHPEEIPNKTLDVSESPYPEKPVEPVDNIGNQNLKELEPEAEITSAKEALGQGLKIEHHERQGGNPDPDDVWAEIETSEAYAEKEVRNTPPENTPEPTKVPEKNQEKKIEDFKEKINDPLTTIKFKGHDATLTFISDDEVALSYNGKDFTLPVEGALALDFDFVAKKPEENNTKDEEGDKKNTTKPTPKPLQKPTLKPAPKPDESQKNTKKEQGDDPELNKITAEKIKAFEEGYRTRLNKRKELKKSGDKKALERFENRFAQWKKDIRRKTEGIFLNEKIIYPGRTANNGEWEVTAVNLNDGQPTIQVKNINTGKTATYRNLGDIPKNNSKAVKNKKDTEKPKLEPALKNTENKTEYPFFQKLPQKTQELLNAINDAELLEMLNGLEENYSAEDADPVIKKTFEADPAGTLMEKYETALQNDEYIEDKDRVDDAYKTLKEVHRSPAYQRVLRKYEKKNKVNSTPEKTKPGNTTPEKTTSTPPSAPEKSDAEIETLFKNVKEGGEIMLEGTQYTVMGRMGNRIKLKNSDNEVLQRGLNLIIEEAIKDKENTYVIKKST
jgi:phosphorylcholine metabolism protein LicD